MSSTCLDLHLLVVICSQSSNALAGRCSWEPLQSNRITVWLEVCVRTKDTRDTHPVTCTWVDFDLVEVLKQCRLLECRLRCTRGKHWTIHMDPAKSTWFVEEHRTQGQCPGPLVDSGLVDSWTPPEGGRFSRSPKTETRPVARFLSVSKAFDSRSRTSI